MSGQLSTRDTQHTIVHKDLPPVKTEMVWCTGLPKQKTGDSEMQMCILSCKS